MDLSVIIPVYQVEQYIVSCLESVFSQGLDEQRFEVIIVNDGTRDHSMQVIADFVSQHANISIVEQQNQGLSVARNNGIAKAQGEYIFMPDSDDLLVSDSLKDLLTVAQKQKADIVRGQYLVMDDKDIQAGSTTVVEQQPLHVEQMTGADLYLRCYNPFQSYVWRALFRREFIVRNQITFYPGIRFQDIPFTTECYLKAGKCLETNRLLNIYRMGHESATRFFTKEKCFNFCIAISETWKLTHWEGHNEQTLRRLQDNVFTNFSFMISLVSYSLPQAEERMEVLQYLLQRTPDLLFRNGMKQRLVTFLMWHAPRLFLDGNYYGRRIIKQLKRR